jgi:hypothetical protein
VQLKELKIKPPKIQLWELHRGDTTWTSMEVVGHDHHVEPISKSMEAVAQHSYHLEPIWKYV